MSNNPEITEGSSRESWDMSGVPFVGSGKERLDSPERMDCESVQIATDLLSEDTISSRHSFPKLQRYFELRAKRLGAEKPVKLYLAWSKKRRTEKGDYLITTTRFNPMTGEMLKGGRWNYATRAFHSEDGTYIQFPLSSSREEEKPLAERSDLITGYEKTYDIIDFAYTCEHELQHDIQCQRVEGGEMTYEALRMAREYVFLSILSYSQEALHLYYRAHNEFFIEKDANERADDFLYEIIPPGGTFGKKVCNPNERWRYTIADVLEVRRRQGMADDEEKERVLSLEKTSLKIPPKTYSGKIEDIVSDVCDDLVAAYPEFYIGRYPVLLLEYNPDGSRRKREDIEGDMAKLGKGETLTIGGKMIDPKIMRGSYF